MQQHYWGIVNSQDQIQGEEGSLYLFLERLEAERTLKSMNNNKSPGTTNYYIASFQLSHSMTYGKIQ